MVLLSDGLYLKSCYDGGMDRQDPRATLVDGEVEVANDVAAKHDILQGLRYYFGEIYYNDHFALDVKQAHHVTLADLSRMHVNAYNESQKLMADCIAAGVDFDAKEMNKFRDFHMKKAQFMADLSASKAEAKMKGGEHDAHPPESQD
jgi:hypothetical protein